MAYGESSGIPGRIRVQHVGKELLVLDPDRGVLHRIAGFEARLIAQGVTGPFADALGQEVLDAVVGALGAQRWDRRKVIGSASALTAAGISTLFLPAAAAASSFDTFVGANFSNSIQLTPTSGDWAQMDTGSAQPSVFHSAYGRLPIPGSVTTIQVAVTATNGTVAAYQDTGAGNYAGPALYGGQAGRGARALASFELPPDDQPRLVLVFSGSKEWDRAAGGSGGSAAGVGFVSSQRSRWLLVAGAGGGAGNAGITGYPDASYDTSGQYTYAGGDGGDAGIGGAAQDGGTGTRDGVAYGRGGAGATTSTFGTGGSGGPGIDGFVGGSPKGPAYSSSGTSLPRGGGPGNDAYANPAGNGGGGLYSGGGGETGNVGAGGGGGGGSSYRDGLLAAPGKAVMELTNRDFALGPTIEIYY